MNQSINSRDMIIGISCSGTAPFVLEFLKQSKRKDCSTALITFNNIKKLEYIDKILKVFVGPEIISGSTRMKSGTATKMILNMITTSTMIKLNKTLGNLMVDLKASNQKLWDRGTRIVSHLTDLNYDNSLKLLQSADGEVKTAIVMKKMSVNAQDARKELSIHSGSLRQTLDNAGSH